MCTSSPIGTPCAARAKASTGPRLARASASTGPTLSRTNTSPHGVVTVDTEPLHRARSLVDAGVRRCTAELVLDDVHRRRRADRRGHRDHRPVLVGGLELYLAGLDQPAGGSDIGSPASRPRLPAPTAGVGRASVPRRSRDRSAGWSRSPMPGMTAPARSTPTSSGTPSLSRRITSELARRSGRPRDPAAGPAPPRSGVTAAGDPPVHPDHRPALIAQGGLEQREPDVDHVNGGRQIDDGSLTHHDAFRGVTAGADISRPI